MHARSQHANLNLENRRTSLFQYLDDILSVSQKKFKADRKKDCSRLKWGGLMVRAIQAYGKLLETVQLDKLMKEIEEIKQHVGITK